MKPHLIGIIKEPCTEISGDISTEKLKMGIAVSAIPIIGIGTLIGFGVKGAAGILPGIGIAVGLSAVIGLIGIKAGMFNV